MKIEGAAALVTGANRGLGAAIAQALLDAGCHRVRRRPRHGEHHEPRRHPGSARRDERRRHRERRAPLRRRVHRRQQRGHPSQLRIAGRRCASRPPAPRWRRTSSVRCAWRAPSRRSFATTEAAPWSTCCRCSRSSPCRKGRPTARRKRPRGRSRTRSASSCDGREPSSSRCTPGSSTPTWPPV